jgi:predicted Zn-dependent protease
MLAGAACAVLLALWPGAATGHENHDQRVAIITEQLRENPGDPALHFKLAETNCEHGDWQATLLNLDTVDRLAPGGFPTPFVRGQALLVGRQYARAKAALDPWLELHADDSAGFLIRARALDQLEPRAAALPDYRAALRFAPSAEPELFFEVAEALAANGCAAEAARVLDDAIRRIGPIASLMVQAIRMERAAGSFDAALARVDTLQRQGPRPEPWMELRAQILAEAGRKGEAEAAWRALLSHLAALPSAERSSTAMCLCAERAGRSLASLQDPSLPVPPPRRIMRSNAFPIPQATSQSSLTTPTSTPSIPSIR